MSKNRQTEKPNRQWLDILAFAVSALALALSGWQLYLSEFRISDDAKATILSMTGGTDTNGYPVLPTEMTFLNEGNRPITIRQVLLCLSETPSFDLPTYHNWDRDGPVIIEPRSALPVRIVFGKAYINNPMILARGFDEPLIYGRLIVDVIDTRGRLHRIQQDACTLQLRPRLFIFWKQVPPWTIPLLPSDAPPPALSISACDKRVQVELRTVNGKPAQLINDGPLCWRLPGVYTNEPKGCWPVKPIEDMETFSIAR